MAGQLPDTQADRGGYLWIGRLGWKALPSPKKYAHWALIYWAGRGDYAGPLPDRFT
jgi:hypothetical protein